MDFDEGRVAGESFVHRVVDDFGEKVMQCLLVGTADIHAGTATNRLQSLENFNVTSGIASLSA